MRTLGLIGGLTWHSTQAYFAGLNEGVGAALGPHRSAPLVLVNLDYGVVAAAKKTGDFRPVRRELIVAAKRLRRAGAEACVICCNSVHRFAAAIEAQSGLTVLHIADAVASEAQRLGVQRVMVLGTAVTMGQSWYAERLTRQGLQVTRPPEALVTQVNRVIEDRLAVGDFGEESRSLLEEALTQCAALGVEAGLLCCTELALACPPHPLTVIDSAQAHVRAALKWLAP